LFPELDDVTVVGTLLARGRASWLSLLLPARVDALQSQMQALLELPSYVASIEARVTSLDAQFAQFRIDVRSQASAERLRGEMKTSTGGTARRNQYLR
jgi:hypothetical protein